MKKIIGLLLGVASAFAFASCDVSALMGNIMGGEESSSSSRNSLGWEYSEEETPEESEHKHSLTRVSERVATCTEEGNVTHWTCDCGKYFLDAMGTKEATAEAVFVAKKDHDLTFIEGIEATCNSQGKLEHWSCSSCNLLYVDEECTTVVSKAETTLAKTAHDLTHHEGIPVNGRENGVAEHWTCEDCGRYYADAEGTKRINQKDTILYSSLNVPDFIVEVPEDRDPVVLQLSDTQIIDAAQARPGRDGVDYNLYATDQIEERCFDYLTEVITATNPDFIIITGDIIYGEFDDNGTSLMALINFMESFQIPWSPVFGNHDNESKKGVDWQCDQLENAKYCLFEQKELSGNCNYSVGIVQGNEVKRVFYMMDSNGCGNASAESKANGHTYPSFVGFKHDQINWYTDQIETLKDIVPDVKISFAYHIQQSVFSEAYAQYGFNQGEKYQDINLDTKEGVAEGDFGYIGRQMKAPWDESQVVYKDMKALGVDSIFVGHEHCNNVSVVYDGVRFTYGLKSSEYDRYNAILQDGSVKGAYGYEMPNNCKPLIGGTVIVLSNEDGVIEDCYNYYCGFENGKIDWDNYKPAETININGLQYNGILASATPKDTTWQMWGDGPTYAEAVKFNDNINAWKVTAGGQGKIYINTALMRGKTTFTFTLYMEEALGGGTLDPFAIRVKPDDGSILNVPGGEMDASNGNKQYIRYRVGDKAKADEVRLELGVWKTYTVDISSFADTCSEFALNIYTGNVMYLRDVSIS